MSESSRAELFDLFDLTGKVAVITGGAGGIGTVYGGALVRAGASVVLADVDGDAAARAAAALAEGCGGGTPARARAIGVALDVTSPESAATMAAAAVEHFGGIDI